MEDISVKEWQRRFANGEYLSNDFKTQCAAGWYDWFCRTESLRNKTQRMGRIILKVKSGGKINMDNWYVWFKNNCPMVGPLYDDFRFADRKTGDVQFTICIGDQREDFTYVVYGRKNDFQTPLFQTNYSRELVKWLNMPWEE